MVISHFLNAFFKNFLRIFENGQKNVQNQKPKILFYLKNQSSYF
jgi:hypothetical protein